MAGNIKGITIEIGGNTTPLQKALSDVNKSIKDTQKQLKEVDKLLKVDPKMLSCYGRSRTFLTRPYPIRRISSTKSGKPSSSWPRRIRRPKLPTR